MGEYADPDVCLLSLLHYPRSESKRRLYYYYFDSALELRMHFDITIQQYQVEGVVAAPEITLEEFAAELCEDFRYRTTSGGDTTLARR